MKISDARTTLLSHREVHRILVDAGVAGFVDAEWEAGGDRSCIGMKATPRFRRLQLERSLYTAPKDLPQRKSGEIGVRLGLSLCIRPLTSETLHNRYLGKKQKKESCPRERQLCMF